MPRVIRAKATINRHIVCLDLEKAEQNDYDKVAKMLADEFKAEKQNTDTTWTVRTNETQHGLAKQIGLRLDSMITVKAIEAKDYDLLVARIVGEIAFA